jgi:GT2 family glycosyltransferase
MHADAQPLVTLSVVSHGNAPEIERLLASLLEHEQVRDLQLILTDNLGRDLPDPRGAQWAGLEIVRNARPQGLARNHNAAIERAQGRYVCMLNPDVVFVQTIFPALVQLLETPGVGIVAPLVIDSSGAPQDSFRRLPGPLDLLRRAMLPAPPAASVPAAGRTLSAEWLAGVMLLMRREAFHAVGGLNEKYHLYFEDVEFCTRARLMGLSLLVDKQLRIQHDASRASRKDLRYMIWHLSSALRFFTSGVYRRARALDEPDQDSRAA